MKELAIIIPAYNEAKNIKKLILLIYKLHKNVSIFIVDDSLDLNTSMAIEDLKKKIIYIHRKKKLGRGSAVIRGLKEAYKNKNFNYFIEMDADFSHRPEEIKNNIKKFKKKKLDLLISSRYLAQSKIYNWCSSRRIFSKLSSVLAKFLLQIPCTDYTNGFRIYSRKSTKLIIDKCGEIGDGFIILSEILLHIFINKYKIEETKTIFVNRVRGSSSVTFLLIFQSLMGLFKLFFIKIISKWK